MQIITSVSEPTWSDETHTLINCWITTQRFGDIRLPFTASPDDFEQHGRDLFADIIKGIHGPIAEYVPPPREEATQPQPVSTGAQTL